MLTAALTGTQKRLHLLKEVNTEHAMKLENALNFTEHPGDSSDSVRRLQ